jgi:prophage regulatory protein
MFPLFSLATDRAISSCVHDFLQRAVSMTDEELPERLIGERECHQITSLSRAHRWRKERVGEFPLRLSLGPKTVRWRLSEVIAWINARPRVEGSPKPSRL